jgi:hypothetical protein
MKVQYSTVTYFEAIIMWELCFSDFDKNFAQLSLIFMTAKSYKILLV